MMAGTSVQDVIAALPMPALAIARNEQIVALNTLAQNLLGMAALGRHYITVLRQPAVVEAVEACLAGTPAATAEYLTREGGNDVAYTVHAGVIGDTGTTLITFQDITHIATAEQMRRDFVANVSHELRTPLTALMGFIETLRGPARNDAPARERFLETMTRETERMNRLIGDLLSLSRVQAAERVRPQTHIDIVAVVASALRTLTPIARDAAIEIVEDLPQDVVMVWGDTDQLTQVIINLVENAIKYGGSGGRVFVTLKIEPASKTLRSDGVVISVRDAGPGIEARHLPRLTERFYRVDTHRSRALGGTGLGLAIVKHILNRHRGRVKVTSEVGQGTEFKVFLPLG